MSGIKYQGDFDLPIPESDDAKEVDAFFGLAAYWAQVLEIEVAHFAVAVSIARDRPANGEVVEELWERMTAKTFGSVLREARRCTTIDGDIDSLLTKALHERNHLTHDFFWDHASDFLTASGRFKMMAVLQDKMALFKEANDRLEPLTLRVLEAVGVSREKLEAEWQELLAQARAAEGNR